MGYIWIIDLWLIFADDLPRQATVDGEVMRRIFELGDILGRGAVLAAVSFGAYILGSLIKMPVPAIRRMGRFMAPRYIGNIMELAVTYHADLVDILRANDESMGIKDLYRYHLKHFGPYAKAISRNRIDLRLRLLVSDKELYAEYDRLSSEAEFRVNATLPVLVLLVILSLAWGLWPLLFVPLVGVFFWQGLSRDIDAISLLIRAIILEKILAGYMASLDAEGRPKRDRRRDDPEDSTQAVGSPPPGSTP